MREPVVIRPRLGIAVYLVVVAIALLAAVPLVAAGRWHTLAEVAPIPLLLVGVGYVVLLAPAVAFGDDAVEIRNPLRTVRVPYDRITASTTHRGFTLTTDDGTVGAWAAPPPDRLAAEHLERGDRRLRDPRVPRDGNAVRTSATPGSPSGDAAITLADRLAQAERMRGAGARDDVGSAGGGEPVTRRWNAVNLAVLAASIAGAIALAAATAA